MDKKIPILFMSDFADTGFGTVGKELTKRWAQNPIFDVHYFGWHLNPDTPGAFEWGKEFNVTLHMTNFWDVRDTNGIQTLDKIIERVQPRIIITLGDPWMVVHVQNSKFRSSFHWVCYTPIDRDVISANWVTVLHYPDVLVLYSEFGMNVINDQMPYRNPVLIKHGVDKSIFKKLINFEQRSIYKQQLFGSAKYKDSFIVGFVGRNQVRKAIPRLFKAFKAFNCDIWVNKHDVKIDDEVHSAETVCRNFQKFRCDICPFFQQRRETLDSYLYLHTTQGDGKEPTDVPGIGWRIKELVRRYGLENRIICPPGLTTLKGYLREHLARIYNAFDVHVYMSHSEGFGLPIAESIACGIPTFVTDYSSMPEIVDGGGGDKINVESFDCYVTYENEWANADIGHAAELINSIFVDKDKWMEYHNAALTNKYIIDWNSAADQFVDVFMRLL